MSAAAFLYGLTLSTTATCYNLMLNHLVRTRAFVIIAAYYLVPRGLDSDIG